jgi:hypothetical protein
MTSSCPMSSGRAATISSAAATGVTGSSSPTKTSVGDCTRAELIEDVDSADELHPRGIELEVLARASPLLFVRDAWPEAGKDARPLVVGHLLATEAAACDLRDLVPGDATEALNQPRHVEAREARLDDEPARVPRMARPVEQDDRAAHRVPEHDRPGDPDRVTEDADIVRACFEAERSYVAPVRPPVPAQIEVNDLGVLQQRGEVRLEVRVVPDSGAAVNEHHRRPLPHLAPVGHERRPIHIEPQSRPIQVDVHRVLTPQDVAVPRA